MIEPRHYQEVVAETPHRSAPASRKIKFVVLHSTGAATAPGTIKWFAMPESKVSAHLLIDKDGTVYRFVPDAANAWHAGVSAWKGLNNLNNWSIGIELVHVDGKDEWPRPQLEACLAACIDFCAKHKIAAADVIGHNDIAPGRKVDPQGFPWTEFRESLASRLKTEG